MRLRRMPRDERGMWRSATTLADLGGLMALWLEGKIESKPGNPRCGPDAETGDLIPVLALACRSGFVTNNSQPGHGPLLGADGRLWQQRAVVDGYVDDVQLLRRLVDESERAGLCVIVRAPPSGALEPAPGVVVPIVLRGEEVQAWDAPMDMDDLKVTWRGINRAAFDAVVGSVHLSIIDPEFAPRNRLWNVLTRATRVEPAPL